MTKRELLEVLDEFDMDEELDMNEVDFVHHFRAEEKKCRFMADKDYRIALYEPGNESLVHASYPTLADAMKEKEERDNVLDFGKAKKNTGVKTGGVKLNLGKKN